MDKMPPLWLFMGYMMIIFPGIGFLFGNLNALAMEPLGHIAGVGAAMIGSLSSLISIPLGILIAELSTELSSSGNRFFPLRVGGFVFHHLG